ncbi:MAG: AbaSI family restriction endonuclease [Saprospiraceae bacterium]
MDPRLEYLSKFFQKTSSKPIENYALTRLWHKLDSSEIQMIPQQYINRHEEKYALTDVFFPQIGLHVEVNEEAHYKSAARIQQDNIRKQEIEKRTGHRVEVIDCRGTLEEIHARIDNIASIIHNEIGQKRQHGSLKTWRPAEARDPKYWRQKPVIRVEDEIILSNIEHICQLFEADFRKTKRGFLRKGAIQHPAQPSFVIWWPSSVPRSGWINNKLDGDVLSITESHRFPEKNREHFFNTSRSTEKRIIFYFEVDALGFSGYHFLGVFELDRDRSNEQDGCFWKRISTKFEFSQTN